MPNQRPHGSPLPPAPASVVFAQRRDERPIPTAFPTASASVFFLHAWTSGPFLRLVLPVARQHKKKHLSSHRVNQGFGSGSGDLLPRSHLFLLLFYYMANTPKILFYCKNKNYSSGILGTFCIRSI
jgi:hypothetical protein